MRDEKWGQRISIFLLVVTLAWTFFIELVLPPAANQWTGAALALWVALVSLSVAAIRAPHSHGQFWPMALSLATLITWLSAGMCSRSWNIALFGPNSQMLTLMFPVTAPPVLRFMWKELTSDGEAKQSVDKQSWPYNPHSAFMTMYFIAIAHLILRFNHTTLSTKIFLAFFAAVSIAAWRMPQPAPVPKPEQLPLTD